MAATTGKKRRKKSRTDPSKNVLPKTYTPKLLHDLDGRTQAARLLNDRYEALVQDTGADSFQKHQLCRRAAFLITRLETLEAEAISEGTYQDTTYRNLTNSLAACLNRLGMDAAPREVEDLEDYLKRKRKEADE